MKVPVKLSPMTRLSAVLNEELKHDKAGALLGLKEKYTGRLAVAEQKRNEIFRSVFYIDAALAFLITGNNFKLPFLDITTTQIPVVVEGTTIASAVALVFAVVSFVTWAAYDAIVRQFGITESQPLGIDPDFMNAAESHVELTLKLLRTQFNIYGPDFHEPGKVFYVYSAAVFGLIAALFVLFPVIHGTLIFLSLSATYLAHGFGFVTAIYYLVVLILTLLAVLIWVGAYRDFTFFIDFKKNPLDPS